MSTFFEDGIVGHVGFADPVCPLMGTALADAADRANGSGKVHRGGTLVCIEGPQFSSRAESRVYRSWGVSVIGMTAMPEAKLAREAELPYAALALSTDYDCWHESEDDVSVEAVVAMVKKNVSVARRTIGELAKALPDPQKSPATGAIANAVMTHPEGVTPEARARLSWLIDKR